MFQHQVVLVLFLSASDLLLFRTCYKNSMSFLFLSRIHDMSYVLTFCPPNILSFIYTLASYFQRKKSYHEGSPFDVMINLNHTSDARKEQACVVQVL